MTVYDFARKCMNDPEFNRGGIVKNERKYIDSIGFEYTVEGDQVKAAGEDLARFYEAMHVLAELQRKYQAD